MPTTKKTTATKRAPAKRAGKQTTATKATTKASAATKQPAATNTPAANTQAPAATGPVDNTQAPVATGPVDTTKPAATNTPAANTQAPAATGPVPLDTTAEIAAYLATPDIKVAVKLEEIAARGDLAYRSMVGTLLTHAADFGKGKPEQTPEFVLNKIFNLYNSMKAIVETPDNAEFRTKMDILNLVFINNSNPGDAFHLTKLLRYDYMWQWGAETLKTHQILCVVISALANRSTRETEIKRININNSFARDGLSITQDTIERLIRYYS